MWPVSLSSTACTICVWLAMWHRAENESAVLLHFYLTARSRHVHITSEERKSAAQCAAGMWRERCKQFFIIARLTHKAACPVCKQCC